MLNIIELLLIFAIGCMAGWILEFIFRSLKAKKIINPGFLNGPYLPIYGFGILILYFVSSLDLALSFRLFLFVFSTTLLELITGMFFLSYYKVRLWDYSKQPLNYKGFICPLYSFFWLILSALFYFFVYPVLHELYPWFISHIYLTFFLGLFYGVFIFDVFNSLSVLYRVKLLLRIYDLNKLKINYYLFKNDVIDDLKRSRIKFFKRYFFSVNVVKIDLIKKIKKLVKEHKKKLKL